MRSYSKNDLDILYSSSLPADCVECILNFEIYPVIDSEKKIIFSHTKSRQPKDYVH